MVCAVLRTVRSRPFGASSRAYSTTVSIIHAIYDDQDSGEHCIILCKVNLGNYLRYMFILLIYLYGHSHFHLVLPRLYYEMNELRSLGVTERVVYMCVMRSKLTFRNSKPRLLNFNSFISRSSKILLISIHIFHLTILLLPYIP